MKTYSFICLSTFALGVILFTGSCKKEATKGCTDAAATNYNPAATQDDGSCIVIPFQGPVNPNFEEGYTGWQFIQGQGGYATFQTGTGFMPTSGYKFLNMDCSTSNNFHSSEITMYQDDINFIHTDSLMFDYSLNAHSADSSLSSQIFVAFEMFFTGNGTDTLWSKYYGSNASATDQKKDFGIALPASAKIAGKLTIKVSTAFGSASLDLDNIRVK